MTVTLENAKLELSDLVKRAANGEEVVITDADNPVARLISANGSANIVDSIRPRFGSGKGQVLYMAPDFDAPLEDFKEYME